MTVRPESMSNLRWHKKICAFCNCAFYYHNYPDLHPGVFRMRKYCGMRCAVEAQRVKALAKKNERAKEGG